MRRGGARLRHVGPLLALVVAALSGAVASPASAFAPPDLEQVRAPSVSDSRASKSATATCPPGKRVLGAGGELDGLGQVVMDDMTPSKDLTSVRVVGHEDDDGTTANWSVTAYAVCGSAPPGLELKPATSEPFDSLSVKSAFATCSPGKQVLGAGGEITGGLGEVVMDHIFPERDLTRVNVVAREDDNRTTANWSVTAYAICARAPVGSLQLVKEPSAFDSLSSKSIIAKCPTGKRVLSAVASNTGLGEVVMDDLIPAPGLRNVVVVAHEDDNGTTANWNVTAGAICATL
jgi:hypothetical protein